jgi:hypothetical protein
MSLAFLFWLIMLLWFLLDIVGRWRAYQPGTPPWPPAGDVLTFLLFLLLGIQVFGWPIHR